MKASKILLALSDTARKALVGALDEGDQWGYRCFTSIPEDAVITSIDGKYVRWNNLVQKGFLTPLGGEVARLDKNGPPPKRRPEL